MLESVYLLLITAAFSFLAMAFWISKPVVKPLFGGFSTLLFGFLAFSATKIEVLQCTDTACTLASYFFDNESVLWFSLMWISAMLSFCFVILLIVTYFMLKGKTQELV